MAAFSQHRARAEYAAMQATLRHALNERLVYGPSFIHSGAAKLLAAAILDVALLGSALALYRHRRRLLSFARALSAPLLALCALPVLFFLCAFMHKKSGLIQTVLLMTGLGIGYGYGSRFDDTRQPRFFSDYDLGLFAQRPVRLRHWLDPRILAARAILIVLTGKNVDVQHYPQKRFAKKGGALLLSLFLERLLLPVTVPVALVRTILLRQKVG